MWIENEYGLLQESNLLKLGIKHFITTRKNGNMQDMKNRNKVLSSFSIDIKKIVECQQIHKNNVTKIEKKDINRKIANSDGLVTNIKNIYLTIKTADCASIFIADIQKHQVGLVHCGWRSLSKNIIKNALKLFYKSSILSKKIFVAIGVHICFKCFRVGNEFEKIFPESYSNNHMDISKEIIIRLLNSGINKENIFNSKSFCSYHQSEKFFSYRQRDKTNRMLSAIWL